MFLAKSILGGIFSVISNIDPSDFIPSDPPPPRRPLHFEETHESEEDRKFRQLFQKLAGDDLEICPEELKGILDKAISKATDVKMSDGGFSLETCRSMVAVMDSDCTGKLGLHEFKYLWGNIKKWKKIFVKYDRDRSGRISCRELPGVFTEDGFKVGKHKELCNLIMRRYVNQDGEMDFNNYVACLVRLDAMCRTFNILDKNNSGNIDLGIEELLQVTMYS